MTDTSTKAAAAKTVVMSGDQKLAEFGPRILAFFIDAIIVGVVASIISQLIASVAGAAIGSLVRLVIFIAYGAYMESSEKQGTFGKIIMKIKVTDEAGKRLDLNKALLRNVGKVISGAIIGIGYLIAFFDAKRQTLHDKIANTLVVSAE